MFIDILKHHSLLFESHEFYFIKYFKKQLLTIKDIKNANPRITNVKKAKRSLPYLHQSLKDPTKA